MKESELLKVLSEFNDVYLAGPAGEVEIEPQMSIIIRRDGSGYETRVRGYKINVKTAGKCKKKQVNRRKILGYIKRFAYFEDGEFELIGIGAERESYEKYLADTDFDKVDMSGLIDIYGDIANRFSLTCPYNKYDEQGEVYCKISCELSEIAEKELKARLKEVARRQLKDCVNLPPFDELWEEIEQEYRDYFRPPERKIAEEHGGNVFMCDRFAEGKTKYTEPVEFWHVYHSVEFAAMCARVLDKMKKSVVEKPLCAEIDGDDILKFNLQDIKVGFAWHCTVSGQINKTFFFELNEDTKKWLMRHKDDYDFDALQDLAFYNDEKILFSSCTHEGFHTDLREVKNG